MHYYPHFTDEEMEAQRGLTSSPKSLPVRGRAGCEPGLPVSNARAFNAVVLLPPKRWMEGGLDEIQPGSFLLLSYLVASVG